MVLLEENENGEGLSEEDPFCAHFEVPILFGPGRFFHAIIFFTYFHISSPCGGGGKGL